MRFFKGSAQEIVGLYKNRLRNRLIGAYSRIFSTNSGAIRSQIYENLPSTNRFLVTIRKARQSPRAGNKADKWKPSQPKKQSIGLLVDGAATKGREINNDLLLSKS